jgi:uncharacterized protein (TIGR00661 family)
MNQEFDLEKLCAGVFPKNWEPKREGQNLEFKKVNKGNVLICPLNWGLGHASRMIPVIHRLRNEGCKVIIAASDAPLHLLKMEFPDIFALNFPGFEIRFSNSKSQILAISLQVPWFLFCIAKEHYQLKKIIRAHKIDLLISDNRYGLWNSTVKSIFVTHQLEIQLPRAAKFFQSAINTINHWFINKYDEVWIPDFAPPQNIAGILSENKAALPNVRYIGILSRFSEIKPAYSKYEVLCILSGPEPQRSIFENRLIAQLSDIEIKACLVRGTEKQLKRGISANLEIVNLANTKILQQLIAESEIIICRSGYSSIMDLIAMNRQAILVPTPGQTEQEYLAQHLASKGKFICAKQDDFQLVDLIEKFTIKE